MSQPYEVQRDVNLLAEYASSHASHISEPGHPHFSEEAVAAADGIGEERKERGKEVNDQERDVTSQSHLHVPSPTHMQRADSVTAAERKRREGERDDATTNLPSGLDQPSSVRQNSAPEAINNGATVPSTVQMVNGAAFVSIQPVTPSTVPSTPIPSSSAATPVPAPSKTRAAVEESPDRQFSRFKKLIGSGSFKDVYLGVDTESGKEVAWNVVDLRKVNSKDSHRIKREIDLLQSLRHPNILQIETSWEDIEREKLIFITERSNNTLKQHINRLHPMKPRVIKKYARQILTALQYIHSRGVIHRDLKCDNIFCAHSGDLVLGDFGLSIAKEAATSLIGTPGFLAPEIFSDSYNELVDIWSFGMVCFEMATNSYPYVECNGVVSVLLKKGFEGIKPDGLEEIQDPNLKEFILMCLQPVEKRPSAQQLLEQKVYDLTEEPPKKSQQQQQPQQDSSASSSSSIASSTVAAVPTSSSTSSTADVSSADLLASRGATTNASSASSSSVPTGLTPLSTAHQRLDNSVAQGQSQLQPVHLSNAGASSPPPHSGATPVTSKLSHDLPVPSSPMLPAASLGASSALPSTPAPSSSLPAASAKPKSSASAPAPSAAELASAKLESLKRRADLLIPKFAVAKTDAPSVVSIFLYTRLKDVDIPELNQLMLDAVSSSTLPSTADVPDLSKLLLIDIPEYDFSRDNYLAVATNLVRAREELSVAAAEIENLEELIASKIEECVREKYNKFTAKARTQVSSAIMSLLTSLGMNLTYAQKFIEQEVSYEDLFLLSDADLTEFIPKLGPRRRLQQFLDSERANRVKAAAAAAAAHAQQQQKGSDYDDANSHTMNVNTTSADERAEARQARKKHSISGPSNPIQTNGNKPSKEKADASLSVASKPRKHKSSSVRDDQSDENSSAQPDDTLKKVRKVKPQSSSANTANSNSNSTTSNNLPSDEQLQRKSKQSSSEDNLDVPSRNERVLKIKDVNGHGEKRALVTKRAEATKLPATSNEPHSTSPSHASASSMLKKSSDSPPAASRRAVQLPQHVVTQQTTSTHVPAAAPHSQQPLSSPPLATSTPRVAPTTPAAGVTPNPSQKSSVHAPAALPSTPGQTKFFEPSPSDVHMSALLSKITVSLTGAAGNKDLPAGVSGMHVSPSDRSGRLLSDSSPSRSRKGSESSPSTMHQLSLAKNASMIGVTTIPTSGSRPVSPLPPPQQGGNMTGFPVHHAAGASQSLFTPTTVSLTSVLPPELASFDTILHANSSGAARGNRPDSQPDVTHPSNTHSQQRVQ